MIGPRSPGDTKDGGVLPDVLAPGLAAVFCGSAPGHVSARVGAYYAGPGNRFWPTLHAVGLTPRRLAPAEFREVLRYGIGLTDLAKHESGVDRDLSAAAYDPGGLRARIARIAPRILAFTAKRPAQAFLGRRPDYGWQPERIGETRLFVLPSPSGAARGHWDETHWRELAAHVMIARDAG